MSFKVKIPPLLQKGDLIAAVSPSWGGASIFPNRYEVGKQQFEEAFGLKVIAMESTLKSPEFLSENPQIRAKDINEAIKDPNIKAIIATIGGEDSVRILPYLDFEAIANNPKFFIGYSDLTAIHFAFLKAGISSIYGPCLMTTFAENQGIFEYVRESFYQACFCKQIRRELSPSPEWTNEALDWNILDNQKIKRKRLPNSGYRFLQGSLPVQGQLIGGCLEVLEMIKGTPVWPDKEVWKDCVLFLDLSEEAPSPTYLTRCLRNYAACGLLENIKGILLSRPDKYEEKDFHLYDDALLHAVKKEAGLDIPLVTCMDFGHTDPICCLPFGAKVEINPEKQSVSFV